jgi:hypothetical protein
MNDELKVVETLPPSTEDNYGLEKLSWNEDARGILTATTRDGGRYAIIGNRGAESTRFSITYFPPDFTGRQPARTFPSRFQSKIKAAQIVEQHYWNHNTGQGRD